MLRVMSWVAMVASVVERRDVRAGSARPSERRLAPVRRPSRRYSNRIKLIRAMMPCPSGAL